ncbi:MAG: TIGR02757 family protein [Brumimicrobium sp.]|nr:TIGR02757 family protein [Brumimicrobium sp.]
MIYRELEELFEVKFKQYNTPDFIQNDPISIPHQFSIQQDIEVIGFITAIIAWGKRAMIISNAEKLIQLMDYQPYNFILNYQGQFKGTKAFKHRTLNSDDLDFICRSLQRCYSLHNSLEAWFYLTKNQKGIKQRIINFRNEFLVIEHSSRSEKHIANPEKGSAAKRINMFLRWMVRKDTNGVDFGLWDSIQMSELYIPLDVHTGNTARKLGLLHRKQNDWKALEEIMTHLQKLDPKDPSKYDFALFGLGINKEV